MLFPSKIKNFVKWHCLTFTQISAIITFVNSWSGSSSVPVPCPDVMLMGWCRQWSIVRVSPPLSLRPSFGPFRGVSIVSRGWKVPSWTLMRWWRFVFLPRWPEIKWSINFYKIHTHLYYLDKSFPLYFGVDGSSENLGVLSDLSDLSDLKLLSDLSLRRSDRSAKIFSVWYWYLFLYKIILCTSFSSVSISSFVSVVVILPWSFIFWWSSVNSPFMLFAKPVSNSLFGYSRNTTRVRRSLLVLSSVISV